MRKLHRTVSMEQSGEKRNISTHICENPIQVRKRVCFLLFNLCSFLTCAVLLYRRECDVSDVRFSYHGRDRNNAFAGPAS